MYLIRLVESVFCCALHPKGTYFASGGEDDRAVVRDANTGDLYMESAEGCFKDSVVHVAFSQGEGTFLAAADMSGVIKVWKVAAKEVVWEFETTDITSLFWHQSANILFATTVDSELWMWKIPSGDSKIYSGHGERAECAELLPDGKRVVVGYADGTMKLFDLKTGAMEKRFSDGSSSHAHAVNCLAARQDNVIFASGGVDGVAKIHNAQTGKNLGAFDCRGPSQSDGAPNRADDEDEESSSAVEAMLFTPPEDNFLVTGSLQGTVTGTPARRGPGSL